MQRLRYQQRRLGVTAADADVVVLGAGCVPSYRQFQEEESKALKAGKKRKPALRLVVYASAFGLLRGFRRNGAGCIGADAVITLARTPSDRVDQWCGMQTCVCDWWLSAYIRVSGR